MIWWIVIIMVALSVVGTIINYADERRDWPTRKRRRD
jgi:hypothetical protein